MRDPSSFSRRTHPSRLALAGRAFRKLFVILVILHLAFHSGRPSVGPKDAESSSLIAINKSQSKTLPDFNRGGVVVFWHVVKTGGVTVRKAFQEFEKWQKEGLYGFEKRSIVVKRSLERRDYKKVASTLVEPVLSRKRGDQILLLWELHGPGIPSVFDMQEDLELWRALAHRHGTGLFVFTLLREPLDFAVSHYNFFHVIPRKSILTRKEEEEHLMEEMLANRQCAILSGKKAVDEATCSSLYQIMQQEFDWIGTTERLSQETLPLLTLLAFQNSTLSSLLRSYNAVKSTGKNRDKQLLDASQLEPRTVDVIQRVSQLDQLLWERAQLDYEWRQ